jgi:hypothetical protein
LAGKRIQLLLAATLAVVSISTSYAYLSADEPPPTSLSSSSWIVQVGALESEAEARERLRTARQYAQPLLDNAREYIETVDKGPKRLYRARFALGSDMAQGVCAALKKANVPCVAIPPTLPTNAAPLAMTPARAAPEQPPSASAKGTTTASPPPRRAAPQQPKSIWQGIKDTTFLGGKSK